MAWAIEEKNYTQRRACGLVGMAPRVYRYRLRRPVDVSLRSRLRKLAAERRRFGYRRLHLVLKRQGVAINWKKLYRLYREERLTVRKRGSRKRALGTRAPMTIPQDANQRWSLDFVADTLTDGRRFRILCVIDDFSRECLATVADNSLSGESGWRASSTRSPASCLPLLDRLGQRHRTDFQRHPGLAGGATGRVALHRTRKADAERLRGELHRPAAGRMPQRTAVRQLPACPRQH